MNYAEKDRVVRAAWAILVDEKYNRSDPPNAADTYDRLADLFDDPDYERERVIRILNEWLSGRLNINEIADQMRELFSKTS